MFRSPLAHASESLFPGELAKRATPTTALAGASLLVMLTLLTTALLLALPALPAQAAEPKGDKLAQRERAERLLAEGRYEESLDAFAELSDEFPEVVALGQADCHLARGRLESAREILQRATAEPSTSAPLAAALAGLEFRAGRHEEARQWTDEALRRNPDSVVGHWWRAELHKSAGRIDEALEDYRWLVDHYNRTRVKDNRELRWIGLAAAEQARLTGNNDQFRVLVTDFYPTWWKREPRCWQAHLDAARLLLEKYNRPAAVDRIHAALAINPNVAELHVARAELAMQSLELASAEAALNRALAIQPNSVEALQLRGDGHLVSLRVRDAIDVLRAARQVNPRDEATLGRLAAACALRDGLPIDEASEAAELIELAQQRNPHCGVFHASMAAALDLARRYPQAAEHYEEARKRMPRLSGVDGRLGLTLMRLGDELRAATLLQEAFEEDPFNVRVKNSLEVLDVLRSYAVLETEHFVLRFDRGQDQLLAQYAARYLEEQVYPDLVKRLGYEPAEKSLIEIFSRNRNTDGHGWFSARMVGLPRIGPVAACAGKVVAMASPNDLPQPYGWARVLRHEFVHVVNLQQTRFNIPHWFTEGLAVFHEDRPRPPAWTRLLVRRFQADDLFTLDDIDLGFLRPADRDDWTLAYCQAELYTEFMQHRYGPQALRRMLQAYASHAETSDALRQAFDVELEAFEREYRDYLQATVQQAEAPRPPSVPGLADLQLPDDPPEDLQARIQAGPERFTRDEDLWLKSLARHYLRTGNDTALRPTLVRLAELEDDHSSIRKKLAQLALKQGDYRDARRWAEEAIWIDVKDALSHALLADAQRKLDQPAEAVAEYEIALSLAPGQPSWQVSLAEAWFEAGNAERARETLKDLLRTVPDHPDALRLLEKLRK